MATRSMPCFTKQAAAEAGLLSCASRRWAARDGGDNAPQRPPPAYGRGSLPLTGAGVAQTRDARLRKISESRSP